MSRCDRDISLLRWGHRRALIRRVLVAQAQVSLFQVAPFVVR
jgi:hypothetical protein